MGFRKCKENMYGSYSCLYHHLKKIISTLLLDYSLSPYISLSLVLKVIDYFGLFTKLLTIQETLSFPLLPNFNFICMDVLLACTYVHYLWVQCFQRLEECIICGGFRKDFFLKFSKNQLSTPSFLLSQCSGCVW